MPLLKFKNPLTTSGSSGFNTSIVGEQDGNQATINTFSIGQDVGTTDNVTFNGITQPQSQTAIIGTSENNMVLGYGFISGSNLQFTVDEQGISENYTHENDIVINGDMNFASASVGESSTENIFKSGSTTFGNSLDDKHHITGSVRVSGSVEINGTSIVGVNNSSDLSQARTNVLVTENAAKLALGGDSTTNLEYIRKIKAVKGTITGTTGSFTATTASISTGLGNTTKLDFQFYLNGMLMEYDALNIKQGGSTFELHIDTNSLGYNLTSDDEVVGWGKFN
tara:strand:+ start:68 stop:910 length:843 start_codon:yes stop_codon:yes gene_type:complete